MSPKLILFAGAPEASSLKWGPQDLLESFIEPLASYVGVAPQTNLDTTTPTNQESATLASSHPAWRSLPLDREHLKTGLSQSQDPFDPFTGFSQTQEWADNCHGASFLIASQIESYIEELTQNSVAESFGSTFATAEDFRSHFYEESYARHEDILSSQLAPASEVSTSFASDDFSYLTDSFDHSPTSNEQAKEIPIAGFLSNVKDIPAAPHLISIYPQTMTVNLIVGIISAPEPRSIQTRRGAVVELVELLIGDETRSPFGVNFWLSSHPAAQETKKTLSGFRPRDVILLRNVALSSFRGRVYGQSLRNEMTKVHLLYRDRVDRSDIGGYYTSADLKPGLSPVTAQVAKTRRVREWVARFVGLGAAPIQDTKKRKAYEQPVEVLPPDTQESTNT